MHLQKKDLIDSLEERGGKGGKNALNEPSTVAAATGGGGGRNNVCPYVSETAKKKKRKGKGRK